MLYISSFSCNVRAIKEENSRTLNVRHLHGNISRFRVSSVSKRVLVEMLSYENQFDLLQSEPVGKSYFRMDGFARRLVLKQRLAKGKSKMGFLTPLLFAIFE